ncbi:hypothetical protein GCM10020001_019220 [Nonomuraea salmonea]
MPRLAASTAALAPPCTSLASTNTATLGLTAASTLAAASTQPPVTSTRLRPWSSASPPATSSSDDSPSAIEPRIHTGPVGPAPSDRAVCGSVAIGSEKFVMTRNGADDATGSVHRRRRTVGSVTELMSGTLARFGE